MDFSYDVKTFLERMCRTCSRFYGETEDTTFYDLFNVKFCSKKNSPNAVHQNYEDEEEEEDEYDEEDEDVDVDNDIISIIYELNDDVKNIFEDFDIWKLNVSELSGGSDYRAICNILNTS